MIEFNCSKCGALLRVPDDALGKAAKCPHCQNIEDVRPQAPQSPAIPPESPPTEPPNEVFGISMNGSAPMNDYSTGFRDSGNPYQSPAYSPEDEKVSTYMVGGGEFVHTKVTFGEILGRMWNTLSNRIDRVLIAFVIMAAIYLALSVVNNIVSAALDYMVNTMVIEWWLATALNVGCSMILGIFFTYLLLGSIRFWLDISRGGKGEFGLLFVGIDQAVRPMLLCLVQYLINLLIVLVFGLGPAALGLYKMYLDGVLNGNAGITPDVLSIILVVIGMLVSIFSWLIVQAYIGCSIALLIDKEKCGIFESIGQANRFGRGSRISIGLSLFVTILIAFGCSLITCCITFGGFYLMFLAAFYVTVYLSITSQPFAFSQTYDPYGNPPGRTDWETGGGYDEEASANRRLDSY